MIASAAAQGDTPTGTVQFMDGTALLATVPVAQGEAAFSSSTLTTGNHLISAVYSGDSNFRGGNSALTQVVNGNLTTTAVRSSSNPSTAGSAVTFDATVSYKPVAGVPVPTGTVTFADGLTSLGTAPLANGAAAFTTSSLATGTHPITAIYSGDSLYQKSNSTALQQVVNANVTSAVALSSSVNPSSFDQGLVFTATVSSNTGTPTGTVTFKDGAAVLGVQPLNAGRASLSVAYGVSVVNYSSLSAGTHQLTATYGGDGGVHYVGAASAPVAQTVNSAATAQPTPAQ